MDLEAENTKKHTTVSRLCKEKGKREGTVVAIVEEEGGS
jgi:hypothetical protein